jgi:hypothetical protein
MYNISLIGTVTLNSSMYNEYFLIKFFIIKKNISSNSTKMHVLLKSTQNFVQDRAIDFKTKLNHEETENLNRPVTSKENELLTN